MPAVVHRQFALGLDYGTNSMRALVADVHSGEEIATSISPYVRGEEGVITDPRDPNVARQHPAEYTTAFLQAVTDVLRRAAAQPGFDPSRIVGIGVDTTGSTPLPVNRDGVPLAMLDEFADEPAALAWLWKDHSSHAEAAEITARAKEMGLPYLAKCGGTYSSEWFWSKILRCERTSPRVAAAAYAWVECCDYIPAMLTGAGDPATWPRGICAAGHKAMYHPAWEGLPSREFLESLSSGLSRFRDRFSAPAFASNRRAGVLRDDLAARVGLPEGIPVAVGALDAHFGAIGAGIAPGTLVKIMGTSTCDCLVAPLAANVPEIPGISGIVPESVLPGMTGFEAGQSAVGDIFNWFVSSYASAAGGSGGDAAKLHAMFSDTAAKLRPGESGLMALDWHNGNRNVIADPLLTGMMVGQTLRTTAPEMYRALIEATAFGALKIIERLEGHGVRIERVVNCGGIAEKSPLVMQIYADVCNRPMYVSRSAQTCALGAAIFGAVVGGAHPDVPSAQRVMTGVKARSYDPIAENVATYRELNAIYTTLHDAFGVPGADAPVYRVMKDLLAVRARVRGRA